MVALIVAGFAVALMLVLVGWVYVAARPRRPVDRRVMWRAW